jgi:hypothetical protein
MPEDFPDFSLLHGGYLMPPALREESSQIVDEIIYIHPKNLQDKQNRVIEKMS